MEEASAHGLCFVGDAGAVLEGSCADAIAKVVRVVRCSQAMVELREHFACEDG